MLSKLSIPSRLKGRSKAVAAMNRFSPKLFSIHLAPPDICPAIGNASKEQPIIIPIIREQHDVPRENPSPGILIKPRAALINCTKSP